MKHLYEQEIQKRVIEELRTLPAFSLKNTSKETLINFFARKISGYIDSKNIADIEIPNRNSVDNNSILNSNQKSSKISNWFERLKISFDFLSVEKKISGYVSLSLFLIAFLSRLFNVSLGIWLRLVIVLLFLLSFIHFSYGFGKCNTNIESTFSQVKRLLKKPSDYAQDFSNELKSRKTSEVSNEFIQKKSEIISKNIINDEIAVLDYSLKGSNLSYLAYSCCLTFMVIYISGDSLGKLIKEISDFLGFNIKSLDNLDVGSLATLVLFPTFFSISKDMVALGLGVRNNLLRRSLSILEDRNSAN